MLPTFYIHIKDVIPLLFKNHSQSVEQRMCLNWSVAEWPASLTSFWHGISITSWEKRNHCHWLSFATVFHKMNSQSHKMITYILFVVRHCMIRLWQGDILTACYFEIRCTVYNQAKKKSHLLPVINQMAFVEIIFQMMVCHQHSVVHWVMSDKLHKHQCCLLSLSRSDVVWCSCCITHSLRDRIDKSASSDRLTHFLLVIWCTITSFTKHKESIMSLTSCRLWDKTVDHKRSVTHKLLSWDKLSDLCYVIQCHLPTESISLDHATKNMVTTHLCFTQ